MRRHGVFVVMAVLFLVACGGDDDDGASGSSNVSSIAGEVPDDDLEAVARVLESKLP